MELYLEKREFETFILYAETNARDLISLYTHTKELDYATIRIIFPKNLDSGEEIEVFIGMTDEQPNYCFFVSNCGRYVILDHDEEEVLIFDSFEKIKSAYGK